MVFCMAIIGAVTRLSGSGLSMTEWRPLLGILPPLTAAEWDRIFSLYQQTPEFIHKNSTMNVDQFKQIFWWEWIHRIWGRLIGLCFILPAIGFWIKGALPPGLPWRLTVLFTLGLTQALFGWFMVQSGLNEEPSVSHYRLVGHLGLAALIMSLMVWWGLALSLPTSLSSPLKHRLLCWLFLGLVVLTMIWGGLVSGLKGGWVYNTFPTMNGYWIPPEVFENPDLLEDRGSVQWLHRLLGIATWCSVLGLNLIRLNPKARAIVLWLTAAVTVQVGLGIVTLIFQVPLLLGSAHQGGALIVLLLSVGLIHSVTRSRLQYSSFPTENETKRAQTPTAV